jgi:hypothetical protein
LKIKQCSELTHTMTGKRKKSSSHSSTKNLSDPLGKT